MPPVIPIVAAVGSMAAGYAALGAATTLLGTIAAGAMMVGGALSLAGTVSGNQKLSKWGSIIGIAGGVGSLANGAFSAVGSELAGEGAGLAAEAGAAGAEATVSEAAQAAAAQTAGTGEVASSLIDPSAAAVAADAGTGTTGLLNEAAGGLATAAPDAGSLAAQAGGGTAGGFGGVGVDGAVGGLGAEGLGTAGAGAGGAAGGGAASPLSDISSWIKNNKELVDVGGGFLKGAMSQGEKKEELLAYLREKEAAENRQRAAYSASVSGASGTPFTVNPNAQVKMGAPVDPTRYQTQPFKSAIPPGFLNNAMQGR